MRARHEHSHVAISLKDDGAVFKNDPSNNKLVILCIHTLLHEEFFCHQKYIQFIDKSLLYDINTYNYVIYSYSALVVELFMIMAFTFFFVRNVTFSEFPVKNAPFLPPVTYNCDVANETAWLTYIHVYIYACVFWYMHRQIHAVCQIEKKTLCEICYILWSFFILLLVFWDGRYVCSIDYLQ